MLRWRWGPGLSRRGCERSRSTGKCRYRQCATDQGSDHDEPLGTSACAVNPSLPPLDVSAPTPRLSCGRGRGPALRSDSFRAFHCRAVIHGRCDVDHRLIMPASTPDDPEPGALRGSPAPWATSRLAVSARRRESPVRLPCPGGRALVTRSKRNAQAGPTSAQASASKSVGEHGGRFPLRVMPVATAHAVSLADP